MVVVCFLVFLHYSGFSKSFTTHETGFMPLTHYSQLVLVNNCPLQDEKPCRTRWWTSDCGERVVQL